MQSPIQLKNHKTPEWHILDNEDSTKRSQTHLMNLYQLQQLHQVPHPE